MWRRVLYSGCDVLALHSASLPFLPGCNSSAPLRSFATPPPPPPPPPRAQPLLPLALKVEPPCPPAGADDLYGGFSFLCHIYYVFKSPCAAPAAPAAHWPFPTNVAAVQYVVALALEE